MRGVQHRKKINICEKIEDFLGTIFCGNWIFNFTSSISLSYLSVLNKKLFKMNWKNQGLSRIITNFWVATENLL